MSFTTTNAHGVTGVSVQTMVHATFVITRIILRRDDGSEYQLDAFSDDPLPLDLQPMQDLRVPCVTESAA